MQSCECSRAKVTRIFFGYVNALAISCKKIQANTRLEELKEKSLMSYFLQPQQMNILLTELLTVARDVLQSLPGEESVFARIAVQKRINQLLNTLFLVSSFFQNKNMMHIRNFMFKELFAAMM